MSAAKGLVAHESCKAGPVPEACGGSTWSTCKWSPFDWIRLAWFLVRHSGTTSSRWS